MKKIFAIAILLGIFATVGAFAENQDLSYQKDESKWSDMTYVTAPILKILESKDSYVVFYQKKYAGTATTVIPKAWNAYKKGETRKLKFRNIKNPNEAYLSVIKKGGEFQYVIINAPMKKNNNLWGVLAMDAKVEGADKETLEELDL